MNLLDTLLLAVGLGMDAFSVALGIGVCWFGFHQVFRLSWHFGLFQFFMPLIGWVLGELATSYIGSAARFAAAAILVVIGGRMVYNVLKNGEEEIDPTCDPTKGWSLVALSLATSIDALGAGFGLGLLGTGLLVSCVIIGVVAALMTIAGMFLSKTVSALIGRKAEIVGGVVLLLLAGKIAFGF